MVNQNWFCVIAAGTWKIGKLEKFNFLTIVILFYSDFIQFWVIIIVLQVTVVRVQKSFFYFC